MPPPVLEPPEPPPCADAIAGIAARDSTRARVTRRSACFMTSLLRHDKDASSVMLVAARTPGGETERGQRRTGRCPRRPPEWCYFFTAATHADSVLNPCFL